MCVLKWLSRLWQQIDNNYARSEHTYIWLYICVLNWQKIASKVIEKCTNKHTTSMNLELLLKFLNYIQTSVDLL